MVDLSDALLMRHHPPLVEVQTVCCLLCDRVAGQLVAGRFVRNQDAPLPASKSGTLRCGHCGGNLHLQPSPPATPALAAQLLAPPSPPDEALAHLVAHNGGTPNEAGTRVVQLSISEVREASAARNSRVRDDDRALDELAASIRRHGLLQPIIVRPSGTHDLREPRYIVVAGNRRLRAARRANLSSVPCLVRVTNADDAFILNVVENLQRRELSGCERIRAITLLASLTDERGHPLGVRAMSRRTGLAPSTISRWLRIDRQPALKAALEQERLDIGRAMQLVGAPEEQLRELIERAPSLPQAQLAQEVEALSHDPRVASERRSAADRRRAEAAERALRLIEDTPEPIRVVLERIQQRVETLLRHCST